MAPQPNLFFLGCSDLKTQMKTARFFIVLILQRLSIRLVVMGIWKLGMEEQMMTVMVNVSLVIKIFSSAENKMLNVLSTKCLKTWKLKKLLVNVLMRTMSVTLVSWKIPKVNVLPITMLSPRYVLILQTKTWNYNQKERSQVTYVKVEVLTWVKNLSIVMMLYSKQIRFKLVKQVSKAESLVTCFWIKLKVIAQMKPYLLELQEMKFSSHMMLVKVSKSTKLMMKFMKFT